MLYKQIGRAGPFNGMENIRNDSRFESEYSRNENEFELRIRSDVRLAISLRMERGTKGVRGYGCIQN
jgi:hypothetical protein